MYLKVEGRESRVKVESKSQESRVKVESRQQKVESRHQKVESQQMSNVIRNNKVKIFLTQYIAVPSQRLITNFRINKAKTVNNNLNVNKKDWIRN